MWDILRARLAQGTRTLPYPPDPASAGLSERFRGLPVLAPEACVEGCAACAEVCPTRAIGTAPLTLDLGRCVFCGECERACPPAADGGAPERDASGPQGAGPEAPGPSALERTQHTDRRAPIRFTRDWRLASTSRDALVLRGAEAPLVQELDARMRRLFGRSLKLRQVSAGGCNGCEAELVAAGNIVFDLGRFGVQFVASPRHADGLVVTGPVTKAMRAALEETYAATPPPKLVIAVGACAISGGPYFDADLAHGGAAAVLPVDLFIPGCPPHPLTILDGLLRLLGRVEAQGARGPAPR